MGAGQSIGYGLRATDYGRQATVGNRALGVGKRRVVGKRTQRAKQCAANAVSPTETVTPQLSAEERILAAVARIPRGRVCTYGGVAHLAGLPRRARLVGTVLRKTTRRVPWFRVINAGGTISFPKGSAAYARQRRHLEAEGIVLSGERIDLDKYGWPERVRSLDEYLWAF